MSVSEAEIAELKMKALGATKGPWTTGNTGWGAEVSIIGPDEQEIGDCVSRDLGSQDAPHSPSLDFALANAAFIAALNPATVLRILADREAASAELNVAGAILISNPGETLSEAAQYVVQKWEAAEERMREAEGLLRPLATVSTAMQFPASVDRREVFVWAESGGANRHISLADADAAAAFLSPGKPSKAKETA